ncbi:hypothetical protein THRCLA_05453 [Thraustotheca clavata]|uniref:EF-hand domain-containing protein n=1 Tax=Thraustotheca clavata TaxID=74557 RepID=A0A1V9ZVX5_9STRA|nr:hypothetical protein THRCLA_05453 [Thraustotheca clavata]
MSYAVRGIARLKGHHSSPENSLRHIVNHVFGSEKHLPWNTVVQKLVVLPDVVYFLADLDMVTMDSLETLIGEQCHLMKDLANIELKLAKLNTMKSIKLQEDEQVQLHGWLFETLFQMHVATNSSNVHPPTPMQLKIEECCRQIFKVYNSDKSNTKKGGKPRNIASLEVKRSFKAPDELIKFLHDISDGTICVNSSQALEIIDNIEKDQLERVACSDMVRWFKQWANLQNHRGNLLFDQAPLWKHAASTRWDNIYDKRTIYSSKSPSAALGMDEAQYSVRIDIGGAKTNTPIVPLSWKVIVDFINSQGRSEQEIVLEYPQLQILDVGYPIALSIELLLWRSVNEATAERIANLLSEFLNDFNVLEGLESLYQSATVKVVRAVREHTDDATTMIATDKFYLQINLLSHRNFITQLEELFQAPLSSIFEKFRCEINLNQSLMDLYEHAQNIFTTFTEAASSVEVKEMLLRQLFNRYDENQSGALELEEVNALLHSLGCDVVPNQDDFEEFFSGEKSIKFDEFVSTFTTNKEVNDYIEQLGGMNNILSGNISIILGLNQWYFHQLLTTTTPSIWRNRGLKMIWFLAQNLTDCSLELIFPSMVACADYLGLNLPCLKTPFWMIKQLHDIQTLFWNVHEVPHSVDQMNCNNLICAAKSSFSKLEHQVSSKQQHSAEETFEMESLRKYLELYPLLQSAICGIQQISIVSRSVLITLLFHHFVIPKPKALLLK